MHDAIVIGAGHNGLVAANVLADAGWSVLVVEAEDEPGGAVRSSELIEPGYVHDRFSAFYPLAAASPVFRALGVRIPFRHGPLVLAHPALDGSTAILSRDPAETTMGTSWPDVIETWDRIEPALLHGLVTPFPQVRSALMLALEPGAVKLLRLRHEGLADRLLTGNALHTDVPPRTLLGRAFGLFLTALGQRYGFPCVEGGAGRITELLVERARDRGVELRLGERLDRVPSARRAVIAAIDVWELGRLTGRPVRVERDPATRQARLDARRPDPVDERAGAARAGRPSRRTEATSCSSASTRWPTRRASPPGKETAWAYSHVLSAAETRGRRSSGTRRASARSCAGGASRSSPAGRVNLGTARWNNELVLRPLPRPSGRRVSRTCYLASALRRIPGRAPCHGCPQAGSPLRRRLRGSASRRRRAARGLASFTISST